MLKGCPMLLAKRQKSRTPMPRRRREKVLKGCPRQKRGGTFGARRMGLAPGQQPHAEAEEGKRAKRLPQGKTEDEGIPCRGRRKEKCNNGMSIDPRREEEKHTKKNGLPQAGGVDPSHRFSQSTEFCKMRIQTFAILL